MDITDNFLNALEVKVEPFAICDIRHGGHLNLEGNDFITVHYALSGRGSLTISDGARFPIETDQIILVPRRTGQRIESNSNLPTSTSAAAINLQPSEELIWLKGGEGQTEIVLACGRIQVTYGADIDIFSLLAQPIVEFFGNSAFIRRAFEEMLTEFSRPRLGTLALTSALMKQCLIQLLRRLHERNDWRIPWLAALADPRLEKSLQVMIEQPEKNHRVEYLAELANMSRSSFTELFTRAIGQPPHEFLTQNRLHRAAHLLAVSGLNVEVIASKVGYQSRSSFSRAFKSFSGQDPMSYRKKCLDTNS